MTTRLSKLALAAALAAALPALAAAHDRDGGPARDGRPGVAPPVYAPAPPPAYAPPAPAPYRAYRDHRGPELRWRDRELGQVRAELARLDAERADFHARFAYRPGQLRRYDRQYLERRAELERREHRLEQVAWR